VDIISAMLNLTRPEIPCYKSRYYTLFDAMEGNGEVPYLGPGKGFEQLLDLNVNNQLNNVLVSMANHEHFIERCAANQNHSVSDLLIMADHRNIIQYRLLSLSSSIMLTTYGDCVYELCRLTALLYSAHVTFPIPGNRELKHHLLSSIKNVLEICDRQYSMIYALRITVWAMFIAGACAFGFGEETYFVQKISALEPTRLWSNWPEFESFLNDFLWLPSACGRAGQWLWKSIKETGSGC
jgi:hypothetical protein